MTAVNEAPPPLGQHRPSVDGLQTGPVGTFEHHMKVLSDSYIVFFRDRIAIEESYVENLRKLQHKARTIDGYLDDRMEQGSTVRSAWHEIRDNIDRETDSRLAFLGTLKGDVLGPLYQLRETQERTRKRIREDLKDAIEKHNDYAEDVLPRLKKSYMKRCQEADEHRADRNERNALSPTISPSSDRSPPQRAHSIAAPSPSRVGGRPVSQQIVPRNRSPSSAGGTTFADLAQQGKKGLTQLKGFLDGKTATHNGTTVKAETALKGVRAKRDAGEADKEYRKGVHWLETLRLHRVKTIEAAYTSLETFIGESAEIVKRSLTTYVDNLLALATTNRNFAEHAYTLVATISPEKDVERIHALMAPSRKIAMPKRIYYQNYTVGDCRDLIFGVALVDYAYSRGLPDGEVPRLVRLSIKEIDERGLDHEGLYRISGRHANVQELLHQVERDERKFEFAPQTDIFCISSLLKQYLRELPEPLFRYPLQDRLQYISIREEQAAINFPVLRSKIRRLPPVHHATLKLVLEHLSRVSSRCAVNKMDVKNLAIVFGAVVFGEEKVPEGNEVLSLQAATKDIVMEDLIIYSNILFDDTPDSPPLPSRPLGGEEQPQYAYGSSYTQVTSIPPRKSVESMTSSGSSAGPPSTTEDFAPSFNNPFSSIHPSGRTSAHMKSASVSSNVGGSTVASAEENPDDSTPRAEGKAAPPLPVIAQAPLPDVPTEQVPLESTVHQEQTPVPPAKIATESVPPSSQEPKAVSPTLPTQNQR